MIETLMHFENIVVIYTLLDRMDLNYLTVGDMEEVLDVAYECNIDLGDHTLTDDTDLIEVYEDWIKIINDKYLSTRSKLIKNYQPVWYGRR